MPSAAVEWVHWKDRVLSVKYRGGQTYDYLDVPKEVYLQYKLATSKGQFINWTVKPRYRYRKRMLD
jgi:hypothetical protein